MLDMDLIARLAAWAAGLEEDAVEVLVQEVQERTEREGEEETVAWLELMVQSIAADRAVLFGQHIQDARHEAQRQAAITVQAAVRGWLARRELERQQQAAEAIQSVIRGQQVRTDIARQHEAATKIQALVRGRQVRKNIARQHEAATKIQALVRGYQQQKEYQELRTAAIQLQSQFRKWQARRELDELKEKDRVAKVTLIQSLVRVRHQKRKYQAKLKFYEDQESDSRHVSNPVLRINDTVTLQGHLVLNAYAEVVQDELKMFYKDAHKPAVPRNRNLVQVDTFTDGWLTAWAKLAWKELYASTNPYSDKPQLIIGESFPCIGSLKVNGAKQHFVEEKVWVKALRTAKATRYNVLGDSLSVGKSAWERAQGIRKALTGDLTGVADIELEAALAMLGAETARNPRSYGVGLMLLDLVENQVPYGSGKAYTWSKILGSSFHPGETKEQYEERKTGYARDYGSRTRIVVDPNKAGRWDRFTQTLKAQAPSKFHKSPVKALYAGKWPMSPSASMSLGGYDIAVPGRTDELNTVQYKELKVLLKWYRFVMHGIDIDAKDETEATAQLKTLFRTRLLSTAMMNNGQLKRTWI